MYRYLKVLRMIIWQFRGYAPQPVTPRAVYRWLKQFPTPVRRSLLLLLQYIVFISEIEAKASLVKLNQRIVDRLRGDGIGYDRIIYVAIDKAASSSHIMLGILRDAINLEKGKRAYLIDSGNIKELQETTARLGKGAIIYVDDFSGTGKQFRRSRDWAAQYFTGSFSEFFIASAMCEEAIERIQEVGVEPLAGLIHTRGCRPLHQDCAVLDPGTKQTVIQICQQIHPRSGLGFVSIAARMCTTHSRVMCTTHRRLDVYHLASVAGC